MERMTSEAWNSKSAKFERLRRIKMDPFSFCKPPFLFGGAEDTILYLDPATGKEYKATYVRITGDGVDSVKVSEVKKRQR